MLQATMRGDVGASSWCQPAAELLHGVNQRLLPLRWLAGKVTCPASLLCAAPLLPPVCWRLTWMGWCCWRAGGCATAGHTAEALPFWHPVAMPWLQAPADFMLSGLSDSTAATAAADAWAAAHPTACDCSVPQPAGKGGDALLPTPREAGKDLEGGTESATALHANMLAATRLQGSMRRLRRPPPPVNSVSLIDMNGQGAGAGGGPCAALVALLMEVWVLAVRTVRWMRRQRGTTATIFATSAIGGSMLGALGCSQLGAHACMHARGAA